MSRLFDTSPARSSPPRQASSAAAPEVFSLLSRPTVTTAQWRSGSSLLLHDGADSRAVHVWNYADSTITRVPCDGDVPPSRLGHAIAVSELANKLFLFGGASTVPDDYPFYCLDLVSFEWTALRTQMRRPECAPAPRVGHTLVTVQRGGSELIVLYGGHPVHGVSIRTMKDAIALGFYSVYCLEVETLSWGMGPGLPMLFNHSAAMFGDRFLMVSGGFEVRIDVGVDSDTPQCDVASETYACDLMQGFEWQRISDAAPRDAVEPPPRFSACLCTVGAELMLNGGRAFDARGREIILQDVWVLDVAKRTWRRLEPFIERWSRTPLVFRTASHIVATADLVTVCKLSLGGVRGGSSNQASNTTTAASVPHFGWVVESKPLTHAEVPAKAMATARRALAAADDGEWNRSVQRHRSATPTAALGRPWAQDALVRRANDAPPKATTTVESPSPARDRSRPATTSAPPAPAALEVPRDDTATAAIGVSVYSNQASMMDGSASDPIELLPSMMSSSRAANNRLRVAHQVYDEVLHRGDVNDKREPVPEQDLALPLSPPGLRQYRAPIGGSPASPATVRESSIPTRRGEMPTQVPTRSVRGGMTASSTGHHPAVSPRFGGAASSSSSKPRLRTPPATAGGPSSSPINERRLF